MGFDGLFRHARAEAPSSTGAAWHSAKALVSRELS
jgi:hypothetical protein